MFFREWNVLIVDDEPDVLTVTKLALKDVTVFGLPLKIHTARSKAEAIQTLNTRLALAGAAEGMCAVAFIDVVMENDQAGLELCDHIRNEMGNYSTQLFIRTGQPGVAPERKVIDDYDISGYFTKMEMTEQKLYTLVKSGVRKKWFSNWYARLIAESTYNAVTHALTRTQLLAALGFIGEPGPHEDEFVSGIVFEDAYFLSDYEPVQLRALRDGLKGHAPAIKTPEGHSLTADAKGNVLVNILETSTTAAYYYVAEGDMLMPRPLLDVTFRNGLVLATLWKRAEADLDQLPPAVAQMLAGVIDAEALRHFSFFASFPAEQLQRAAERLPVVSAAAQTTVFALGDVSATMYLILDGQVKIHRSGEKGEAVELGTLGPDQTFGELAMLSHEPRSATVTALTDCRFLVMERPLLLDMLRDAPPEAVLDMFAVLSRQIRAANDGEFRKLLASRTLESQMEVEKQRGLTQMVAGVAHEINTPLGVAVTAASIVARELDKLDGLAIDRKSKSALEDIREALGLMTGNLERAHKLVQDFKKVSVSQLSDEKEPLDLPEAIRDTLNLAQVSLKRSQITVAFSHTLPPEAHTWVGYRGYLSQILLNLLTNIERYAYPAGQGGAAEVSLALAGPGEYALRIQDFGRGIPPANLDRVFEPFFTTGRGSGGSGLGLTIVYNLVTTALKGRIALSSVVGQGTIVEIIFPRVIPN